MLITRGKFLLHGVLTWFASDRLGQQQQQQQQHPLSANKEVMVPKLVEKAPSTVSTTNNMCDNDSELCQKHNAPGVNYQDNPTVFGSILQGQLPAMTLAEDDDLLAFMDRYPRAPLHALVIPKQYIPTVFQLTQADIPLLQDMRTTALNLIKKHHPEAYARGDYILCFHVPPFNSIDHLHLHVLAPASEMKWYYRFIKYQVGLRWCVSDSTVRKRLERGKGPLPYNYNGKHSMLK